MRWRSNARGETSNLYRIDDILLKAGSATLLVVLATAASVVVSDLAEGSSDGREPGLAALAQVAGPLSLAALCPIALLGAGFTLRRRERQIVAVWNLLRQNAELSVPGLLANSDLDRLDLERAVRFLNNRGIAHYCWDRDTDTIQDGRLRAQQLHVEKCDACGASISLRTPLGFRKLPVCPFCQDPISADSLEQQVCSSFYCARSALRPSSTPGSSGSAAEALSRPGLVLR